MTELEDVDLTKALDRLSKLTARIGRDIMLELADPKRTMELADVLEETARQLRQRADTTLPRVIEGG